MIYWSFPIYFQDLYIFNEDVKYKKEYRNKNTIKNWSNAKLITLFLCFYAYLTFLPPKL